MGLIADGYPVSIFYWCRVTAVRAPIGDDAIRLPEAL
jgi:hypothetical protein